MFRFIINWIRRRRARKARDIFAYFDGHGVRRADPFAIESALGTHPTFSYDMLSLVEADDREATEITLGAICDAFGVRPWDPATESGLTKPELLRLFMEFDGYVAQLKKKYNLGATLPAPTEPTFSSTPEDSILTNLPLDSTSTAPAQNSVAAPV